MKPLLITNFTKRNASDIAAFLKKHDLFGATILVKPDDFTDYLKSMMIRYGVNVVIDLYAVDGHIESLENAETRNPGLEERMLSYPAHKLSILRRAKEDPAHGHIVALSLSFPHNKIYMAKCPALIDGYYQEREQIMGMQSLGFDVLREQLGVDGSEGSFADIHEPLNNIDYMSNFDNFYSVLDFTMLSEIGLIGSQECIQVTNL